MSEQIVVGKLRDPTEVIRQDGSTFSLPQWHKRAMWSYLRLIRGRSIDDTIKERLEKGEDLQEVFVDLFDKEYKDVEPRTLQFIIDDKYVRAVASTKHLLISPQSLSTISGATLLLDDIEKSKALCRKWLGEQKSNLADALLKGRLP